MVTILQMHRCSWETIVTSSVAVHSVSQQEAQAYCICQRMLHTWYNPQRHSRPLASPSHQQKAAQGPPAGGLTGPLHCQTSRRAGWVPKMTVQPRHLRQGWRGHGHRTEGVL